MMTSKATAKSDRHRCIVRCTLIANGQVDGTLTVVSQSAAMPRQHIFSESVMAEILLLTARSPHIYLPYFLALSFSDQLTTLDSVCPLRGNK